jgi:hypothetical protein
MTRCCSKPCVPLSKFVEYIRPMVVSAPDGVIEQYVRQALIEFAQKTLFFQRDYYIDLQENVSDYTIPIEDGFYPHMIREVSVNGMRLHSVERPPLDDAQFYGKVYFEKPCRIVVGHCPDEDCTDGLLVRADVVPSQDTCCVDQWIFDTYLGDIAQGALSHLLIMPGAAWFNPQQGGIFLRRWKGVLANIKTTHHKGYNSGPTIIKVKRFV